VATFAVFDPATRLTREYWISLAPGLQRIEVEIGSGDGKFLVEAALQHPTSLFVGFEVSAGSVARVLRRSPPPNALIKQLDGRWVVEHVLADRTIDAYHVYFPDPWWKKRHAKRRLFSGEFAQALRRTLVPGGSLYLLTDVETRYREIESVLAESGFAAFAWERSANSAAQSSYERKYRAQGRSVWGARFAPA
jgi:tRNA (guanine-N7-)-methyltransferase